MKILVGCMALLLASCTHDSTSAVKGAHWHYSTGGDRFLVETDTARTLYWTFTNAAGSCTAISKVDYWSADYLTCDAAMAAIEKHEIERIK